ncbi:DUF4488 domain-containing protein [Neolewinella maritima]|uniref:DUF4488 domain-containing protein n=1 Tax=Neolewinella maritima TaxID=1383882 RepID=UPI001EE8F359|nr:DUF4488 domain-containing protein [Neolewinella maritima]
MKYLLFLLLASPLWLFAQSSPTPLEGAWESSFAGGDDASNDLLLIVQDGFFAMTAYNDSTAQFIATLGGSYTIEADTFMVTYEFDSSNPENVGRTVAMPFAVTGSLLVFNGDKAWQRLDDGSGELAGAWEITGRKQDGEMRRRPVTGPRRTMKILSGSHFQWIAYNTETAEFLGTGGGRYSVNDGQYIEYIDFFSRDPQRVGKQLSFDYKIRNNEWHHMGVSSSDQPLYETWGHRPPARK